MFLWIGPLFLWIGPRVSQDRTFSKTNAPIPKKHPVYEYMQDDDQEREGVDAQGERARPLPQPRLPSRQDVQEHELTHISYRSWCVHCVRGAGRPGAHRRRARQDEEEREQHMTTWSIDYAFMIDNSDLCTTEEMETSWMG